MEMQEELSYEDRIAARARRTRQDGVKYKLRVIEGSGGLLELVEEKPPRHWFHEWARAMSVAGWGI